MKNLLSVLFITAVLMMGGNKTRVLVLSTNPEMHCQKCESKIKKHMMYEKGIQKIETSLEKQTITFTYDAQKTNKENIQKAMEQINYSTKVIKDEEVVKKKK